VNKEELLKKIKALAEAGIGGEKKNAQEMLKKLMKKYKIKEKDIEIESIKKFNISIPRVYNAVSLACQVFYSIVGKRTEGVKGVYQSKHRYYVKCTNAEFIEFEAKYKFYCYHYKKELERFLSAFIQANGIFPPKGMERKSEDDYKLTEEDLKMLALAESLDKHHYNLQITGGVE